MFSSRKFKDGKEKMKKVRPSRKFKDGLENMINMLQLVIRGDGVRKDARK